MVRKRRGGDSHPSNGLMYTDKIRKINFPWPSNYPHPPTPTPPSRLPYQTIAGLSNTDNNRIFFLSFYSIGTDLSYFRFDFKTIYNRCEYFGYIIRLSPAWLEHTWGRLERGASYICTEPTAICITGRVQITPVCGDFQNVGTLYIGRTPIDGELYLKGVAIIDEHD